MAEVDSYLMSVYNSTKGVTSASFAPFFSEAAAQSSMFKTATKAMGEGIQSGWDDMVRITYSGTAAQIASKFEEFDKAIDQLQPVGGYVDQFNAEMEKYITAVENANKYQDELDHFTLPNAPTKPGEGSSDETWEKYYNDLSNYHSKIEYGKDTLELPKLINTSYEGKKFYLLDDIYATGNTLKVIKEAIESLGGIVVGEGVVMNIKELNDNKELFSLIDINEE